MDKNPGHSLTGAPKVDETPMTYKEKKRLVVCTALIYAAHNELRHGDDINDIDRLNLICDLRDDLEIQIPE